MKETELKFTFTTTKDNVDERIKDIINRYSKTHTNKSIIQTNIPDGILVEMLFESISKVILHD